MADEDEVVFLADPETYCNICFAEFLDAEDLNVHIGQVHENSGVRCHFCSSVFRCLEDYAVHIRDNHLLDLRCCKYCCKVFSNAGLLRNHERKHATNASRSVYNCSQCDTEFEDCNRIELHEFENHNNAEDGFYFNECLPFLSSCLNIKASTFIQSFGSDIAYVCTMCMHTTMNVENYLKHLQERNCKSYVCNRCCNVYRAKKSLVKHLHDRKDCHLIMNKFDNLKKCKICFKEFKLSTYRKHIIKCMRPVSCQLCDIKLNSIDELSLHQSNKHPMAILMTTCKFCQKEFVGKITLQKHIDRCHKSEMHLYKYACLSCNDRYFKHPKLLFAHYFSKHNDMYPFTCKICDEKFRVRKKFTLHIKLKHNSEGFVEFDEYYCVFFTDRKSKHPFQPTSLFPTEVTQGSDREMDIDYPITDAATDVQTDAPTDAPNDIQTDVQTDADTESSKQPLKIRLKEEHLRQKQVNLNSDAVATNGNQTDGLTAKPERKVKKCRKRSLKKNVASETIVSDLSDDEPLIKVKKRMRTRVSWNRRNPARLKRMGARNKQNFTCNICNKYCYTYQNYHLHVSTHKKNEAMKCIKCSEPYYSQVQLDKHMEKAHRSSMLTDTLKNLLERRKKGLSGLQSELTPAEKFRKTIQKVRSEQVDVAATIKELQEDLSVQKFIESFVPEETNKKRIELEMSVTVKTINKPRHRPPKIKMTKFKPSPTPTTVKLAMPVKCKNAVSTDAVKVNISMVENFSINFDGNNDFDNEEVYTGEDVDHEDYDHDKNDTVPEMAQEVMLESQEPKPPAVPYKIVIPPMAQQVKNEDIKIAHMLPEAPYYKIVKMADVLISSKKSEPSKPIEEPEEEIALPRGRKLVNVNPLAHLIGNTPINTGGSKYYKPKPRNFESAIAKALLKLEQSGGPRRASKKKPTLE